MDVVRADWTSFERQVGELGMLITALGQTETRVAEIFFFREVLKKSPQSVHSKVKTVSTHAHTSPLGLSPHEPSVSVVTFHLVRCKTPAIPAVTLQHVQQG